MRGFLGLKRTRPAWASLPQLMRFSVSTWNVLKMLRMWDARTISQNVWHGKIQTVKSVKGNRACEVCRSLTLPAPHP